MNISPSILTESVAEAQQQLEIVRYSSLIDAVQIDIVDAQFSDSMTITPLDITVADFEPLKIDLHLMTEEPLDYVYECEAVKDYLPIRCIYGQVERMTYQKDFLQAVKANNWRAGLALDLYTPLEEIHEEVWPELDHILLMAVEAGRQGQHFNKYVIEKVKAIREVFPSSQRMYIVIDGGIKTENAQQVIDAGADEFAIGSDIWRSPEPLQEIEKFYHLHQQ